MQKGQPYLLLEDAQELLRVDVERHLPGVGELCRGVRVEVAVLDEEGDGRQLRL